MTLTTVVASRAVAGGPVVLGVDVREEKTLRDARTGPDTASFGIVEPDGTFTTLATLDGRYLETNRRLNQILGLVRAQSRRQAPVAPSRLPPPSR